MAHQAKGDQGPDGDLDPFATTAYVSIRDRIIRLDLPPGCLLSENLLGAQLGLSRTPVREALKRLEREYLVTIMPRRGILVTEVDLHQQLQLLEMRRGIEMRLIGRGIERSSEAQRATFGTLASQMQASADDNDLDQYVKLDAHFDAIIDDACANRFLSDAMRPVHGLIRRYWHTEIKTAALREALQRHVGIVHAAAAGRADQARKVLLDLCDHTEHYLLNRMR